ncbi:MAG: TorF family putative porin [Gammaproteobacteria bacterium]|nr:TorF family putative porin [Gammaproteobacteria bacterium]
MKFLITGLALTLLASTAQADLSANLGYASEYHYRGILQKNSSASGGLDYEQGGFYVGTWAAVVGDGLEVDGYFGYGTDVGDVSLSVGFTGYYYTGDFDDTYQEINLGAGFGLLSLDVAIGEYDNFTGPTLDYTFYALSIEKDGFSATLGSFAQDFDGDYLQLGYDTTISEIDFGVALIFANDDLVGDKEESLIFTVGKSFDLN